MNISRLASGLGTILGLALVAAGCAEPVPVHSDLLGETFYTRCVLRNKGEDLRSSNPYRLGAGGYPPGSEVRVRMFSAIRIDLEVNNIPHKMYPVGDEFNTGSVEEFFEKYFVKTREEIGAKDPKAKKPKDGEEPLPAPEPPAEGEVSPWRMDAWEKGFDKSVMAGVALIGMDKHQVYMALGPPPEINFDTYAVRLNLQTIMEANRWVYYGDTWFFPATFFRKVLTFDNEGKLVQLEQ